jgi:type II secretory ATPase GspE/PulE/Tfp pilus assembly ATPase PilB-like protein
MNILTIEDPVEYQLPDIGQIQVRPKLGLTFAEGLRHILRQDPDVILVGEIRDRETADIAVRAALTGHLVLSTLHTNDAPSALVRLADIGIQPYLIASALYGVIAQRLVRTVSTQGQEAGEDGYAGRTGIYEWFEVTEEVRQSLRSGDVETDRLRSLHARQSGGRMRDDAAAKVRAGRTTEEEVRRVLGVPSAEPRA